MPHAPRVCAAPGCPVIVTSGTCTAHARPRTKARGYGGDHAKLRRRWAPEVATGSVKCWRCGELIAVGEAWDLGHDDGDRAVYRGPEHAGRCNRAAAGRSAHQRWR